MKATFEMIRSCDRVTGRGLMRKTSCDIVYRWRDLAYVITMGFEFNGASVPFPLWWWVYPFDKWVICAAAIHDELYESHRVSRRDADLIFWHALRDGAVRLSRCRWRRRRRIINARIMYRAVRVFGERYWDE
jgi:hypothetical protein